MLIVYDLTTGEVLGNSGTNTSHPLGPPSLGEFDNAGELRLHDLDDAEMVAQVLNSVHHVDVLTGEIVIDEEYPSPTFEGPTQEERIAALEAQVQSLLGQG